MRDIKFIVNTDCAIICVPHYVYYSLTPELIEQLEPVTFAYATAMVKQKLNPSNLYFKSENLQSAYNLFTEILIQTDD